MLIALFVLIVFGPFVALLAGPFVAFHQGRRAAGEGRALLISAALLSLVAAVVVWFAYVSHTLGLPGCPATGLGFVAIAYGTLLIPLLLFAAAAGSMKRPEHRGIGGIAVLALGVVALFALVGADQTIFCGLGN